MISTNTASTLSHLACPECGRRFEADRLQSFCPDCRSPILARYDLEKLRNHLTPEEVKARPRGLWRWAELLPVRNSGCRFTLGEGDTPLLPAPRIGELLGLPKLYIKDESVNPTGTFKARGLAVAVARAVELGVQAFVIPSAGNAGGALATYATRASHQAHVFMPRDAPRFNKTEVRLAGADLRLVDGPINEAAREAASAAASAAKSGQTWFDVSTFKEPYRVEGKKTMGFEIAESFGWELPDVIVYPTGGGTGLVGFWKAFEELGTMGWIGTKRPRLVSVQAEGCAPIVHAFQAGARKTKPWKNPQTVAVGLRVPLVFADRLILDTLYASQGIAVAVTDEDILSAQSQMARMEGIFPAPEGAATLAGLLRLLDQGWIRTDETVILLNTGTGLKYLT